MTEPENSGEYFDSCFNKQELSYQNYSDVVFERCEFINCDFTSTVFSQCKFLNCQFDACNLSLTDVPGSRFSVVEFTGCKLVGIDWTKGYWPAFDFYSQLSFKDCILDSCNFFDLKLHESHFEACRIHDADFRNAELCKSFIQDCDLSNSLFMHTNLENTNLAGSHSFNIDIRQNKVTNATFSRIEALDLLRGLDIHLVD